MASHEPLTFDQLLATCPRVAEPIRDRFAATGLAILGTIRADGSPRVSPIEVTSIDDRLYLGMMPGSTKCRDVERDPRCTLLTPVADKDDLAGEGKLRAVVRPLEDPDTIAAIFHAAVDGTDFDAADLAGSPVYEVLVLGAAWQHVEADAFVTRSWTAEHGERLRTRVGSTGQVEERPPD